MKSERISIIFYKIKNYYSLTLSILLWISFNVDIAQAGIATQMAQISGAGLVPAMKVMGYGFIVFAIVIFGFYLWQENIKKAISGSVLMVLGGIFCLVSHGIMTGSSGALSSFYTGHMYENSTSQVIL